LAFRIRCAVEATDRSRVITVSEAPRPTSRAEVRPADTEHHAVLGERRNNAAARQGGVVTRQVSQLGGSGDGAQQ
jgi:hypothetical protein